MNPSLKTCVDKIMSAEGGGQTDRQTDGQTDRQTDTQMGSVKSMYIYTSYAGGGGNKLRLLKTFILNLIH